MPQSGISQPGNGSRWKLAWGPMPQKSGIMFLRVTLNVASPLSSGLFCRDLQLLIRDRIGSRTRSPQSTDAQCEKYQDADSGKHLGQLRIAGRRAITSESHRIDACRPDLSRPIFQSSPTMRRTRIRSWGAASFAVLIMSGRLIGSSASGRQRSVITETPKTRKLA